jgi:hypothetical protein
MAASVASLAALQGTDLSALVDSPVSLPRWSSRWSLFTGSPALALLPLVERSSPSALHVAFSLLVWQAFQRRKLRSIVVLAILLHAAYDAALVYIAQQVDQPWLIEGCGLLLAAPAWLWIIYLGAARVLREPAEDAAPLIPGVAALPGALRKELLQQVRTKRLLVVAAVFALFGLGSPLIANFTPQLLQTIEGAEQFADSDSRAVGSRRRRPVCQEHYPVWLSLSPSCWAWVRSPGKRSRARRP